MKGNHLVKVLGGPYAPQSSYITHGKWRIRSGSESVVLTPRAAICGVEKVSEARREITYKVTLMDGHTLLCASDRRTFDGLYAEMTTGPKEGDVAVETVASPKTNWGALSSITLWFLPVLILGIYVLDGVERMPTSPARATFSAPATGPASASSEEVVATVLNLNGYLCAHVDEVRRLEVQNQYEVTCIERRGGSGTVRYIVDATKGTAFKAD